MNGDAGAEIESSRGTRRNWVGLVVAALMVLFAFCCVGSCALFGYLAKRRGAALEAYDAPPAVDPAETDVVHRLVAEARRDASSHRCVDIAEAMRASLAIRSHDEILAFHARLGELIASLDTQPMRSACQAALAGSCDPSQFVSFRAGVVLLGPSVIDGASRDPDSLARYLPGSPICDDVLWVARAALRSRSIATRDGSVDASDASLASDAGVESADVSTPPVASDASIPDASVAPGQPVDPSPIDESTTTRLIERGELGRVVPRLCRRFLCGPRDLL